MIDLLVSPCGQLLTLAADNSLPRRKSGMSDVGLIADGALGVSVSTGTIEYAGPAADLKSDMLSQSCPQIDAAGCVVMPGFIDSHTHLVFGGSRANEFYRRARGETYQEISRSGGGIYKTVEHTRLADEDELFRQARARLLQLIRNGTCTVETKSGYGLDAESELKLLTVGRRLRESLPALLLSTYLGAHFMPEQYADRRDAYVELVASQLAEVAQAGLADFYDIFVDPLAFTLQEARHIEAAGRKTGLGLKLHADEFGDDGTAAWGVEVGALSCDHLGGVGAAGIEALAASDTIATLLPATMFFSGHDRYAPARRMIEAGCALALATDLNPGSSLVYSMPLTMTLAVLKMALSAEECVVASTINAAHALGIAELTGSLETGKRADVIILDVPHYEEIPYHLGRDLVRDVIINGRVVKSYGRMVLGH